MTPSGPVAPPSTPAGPGEPAPGRAGPGAPPRPGVVKRVLKWSWRLLVNILGVALAGAGTIVVVNALQLGDMHEDLRLIVYVVTFLVLLILLWLLRRRITRKRRPPSPPTGPGEAAEATSAPRSGCLKQLWKWLKRIFIIIVVVALVLLAYRVWRGDFSVTGPREVPITDPGDIGSRVRGENALVLYDNSGSMKQYEQTVDQMVASLKEEGLKVTSQAVNAGGVNRVLSRALERGYSEGMDTVYFFSDFADPNPEIERFGEFLMERGLRLYVGTVRFLPCPEVGEVVERTRGEIIVQTESRDLSDNGKCSVAPS